MEDLPRIGITMGDPAGVGPEIIAKVLREEGIRSSCTPLILGDPDVMVERMASAPQGAGVRVLKDPREAGGQRGSIDLIPVSRLGRGRILPGTPTKKGGKAMVDYVLCAVELALSGVIDAVVTGPINKRLMQDAGYPFEGHTELLAHLTGTDKVVMMLAGSRLRVSLVTIHRPLREVPDALTEEGVYETVRITARALQEDFGVSEPRLAVAALNPHAGEEGLFGQEEARVIAPAVERARRDVPGVSGPFPADTLFFKAASGLYDAVVAMYHDQGLIPLKLLHFSDAVNVTLGLPIVRTSVDHGTAYDIAGRGLADSSSLKAALQMAAQMAGNRRRGRGGR